MSSSNAHSRFFLYSLIGIVVVTIAYVLVYQFQPLPGSWNDTILNFSYSVAAGLGALAATLVWKQFQPGEMPRRVWGFFALGLWGWTLGETLWAIFAVTMDEVPDLSLADLPWVGAYVFFAISFFLQFRLIYGVRRAAERKLLILGLCVSVLGALLGTLLMRGLGGETEQTWLETYVAVFYPLADLVLVIAAVKLWRVFGRGMWGRAWIGLLVMAIADLLYSFLTFSGLYAQSASDGNPLSLLADTLYFDSYLLLAVACYAQYLLLRHGPPATAAEIE